MASCRRRVWGLGVAAADAHRHAGIGPPARKNQRLATSVAARYALTMPTTVAISTVESGTKPNSVDTRPKNGVARANAVAATVVQRRRSLGRLRHEGPRVRRTRTTPSSVSSDTTNHVV